MPTLSQRLVVACHPELRSLPESERLVVLERGRETPFDIVELIGMAAGLALVTAITSYSADGLSVSMRVATGIANMVIALPLLAVTLGPFLWRRTRRGVRAELDKHQRVLKEQSK
jgi:hypothetical protein